MEARRHGPRSAVIQFPEFQGWLGAQGQCCSTEARGEERHRAIEKLPARYPAQLDAAPPSWFVARRHHRVAGHQADVVCVSQSGERACASALLSGPQDLRKRSSRAERGGSGSASLERLAFVRRASLDRAGRGGSSGEPTGRLRFVGVENRALRRVCWRGRGRLLSFARQLRIVSVTSPPGPQWRIRGDGARRAFEPDLPLAPSRREQVAVLQARPMNRRPLVDATAVG